MGLQHRRDWTSGARLLALIAALAIVLALSMIATGCGGGASGTTTTAAGASTTGSTSAGGTGGAQVVMKGFAFDPASITIKAGESVTWTNQGAITHTVDGDNGEFKSGNIAAGATFTFKFDKAGTYAYHCSLHPNMKATVVVQ